MTAHHEHDSSETEHGTLTRWSAFLVMLFVCALMFAGAFLAGQYGNGLRRNPKELALLNVFGSGLLLGTALGIIIPEGARALHEKGLGDGHQHAHGMTTTAHHDEEEEGFFSSESLLGWTLVLGFLTMMMADHTQCFSTNSSSSSSSTAATMSATGTTTTLTPGQNNQATANSPERYNHFHHHGHSHFGAIDMQEYDDDVTTKNDVVLAEDLEKASKESTTQGGASSTPSLTGNLVSSRQDGVHDDDDDDKRRHSQQLQANKRRSTVTLGLLIHNAFDGLAMGAAKAASSEWNSTQTIVFWAIMMHHVPAAFGFATFLRSTGHEEFRVQRDLMWFSVAGPAAAFLTFLLLHDGFLGVFDITGRAVGCCLLFSGGTFLYVATVHALDEAKRAFPNHVLGPRQLSLLCLGAILPLILSSTAGHGH